MLNSCVGSKSSLSSIQRRRLTLDCYRWLDRGLQEVNPTKGVVFLGDRECEMRDFPDPVPNDGEVRVKMMVSGICGSALHLYREDHTWEKERGDRIPGREPCGVVDAIGTSVAKIKERPCHRVPLSGLWDTVRSAHRAT